MTALSTPHCGPSSHSSHFFLFSGYPSFVTSRSCHLPSDQLLTRSTYFTHLKADFVFNASCLFSVPFSDHIKMFTHFLAGSLLVFLPNGEDGPLPPLSPLSVSAPLLCALWP